MTSEQHVIYWRLKLLCEGDFPFFHNVMPTPDGVAVYLQPWGTPVDLTWEQARSFVDLQISWPEAPPQKRGAQREDWREYVKQKHG